MDYEYRVAREELMAVVIRMLVRGRSMFSWMDGVKVAFAALECAKDRKEWRSLVDMSTIEFNSAIFEWPSFLLTALLRSGGLSPGDGSYAVT